ncbi:hypothetical protein [Candidatus Enterococcus clewellii]|uniref:hypothetical protein n=1 Tax=Candidatus Enterococcus clewellii TaxID=1834193 RepID=UPI0030CCFE3B
MRLTQYVEYNYKDTSTKNTKLIEATNEDKSTFISLGEATNPKDGSLKMVIASGSNSAMLNFTRIDKADSPLKDNKSSGGISFSKVLIYSLISISVIAYIQHKKKPKGGTP